MQIKENIQSLRHWPLIVRLIHWWLVNCPHKGPVTWKMFPFDDVIMMLQQTMLEQGSMITLNDRQGMLIHEGQFQLTTLFQYCSCFSNKANLRDLIAATGLVILLKFDPNHRFFSPCDLEIWCMTSKNNRAPLLYYIKLCVSFQIHRWIQTKVTLRKRSIRVEIGDFLSLVTLKFDGWPWKMIGHLFYTTSSFVHHFKSIGELKLKLQSRNA